MKCVETFIEADVGFINSFSQTKLVDPIGFSKSGDGARFQTEDGLDELAIDVARNAAEIIHNSNIHNAPKLQATYRDLDKVYGYYACRREDVPPEIKTMLPATEPQSSRPRCNTYEYFLGADHHNPTHLYTGRSEEQHLIQITAAFLREGHTALHGLLRARDILHSGHSAYDELSLAYSAVNDMRSAMLRAYKEVTPQFVTEVITGRMRGVKIGDVRVEGPNASHSVSLLIDRLVIGDFGALRDNPGMREAISGRLVGLPPHLLTLFESIEAEGEEESIVELSKASDKDVASAITAIIRKTKVAHKSYADKGSLAKLKRDAGANMIVTPTKFVDVLGPTIEVFRSAETPDSN